jgi:hypothetical protein
MPGICTVTIEVSYDQHATFGCPAAYYEHKQIYPKHTIPA